MSISTYMQMEKLCPYRPTCKWENVMSISAYMQRPKAYAKAQENGKVWIHVCVYSCAEPVTLIFDESLNNLGLIFD